MGTEQKVESARLAGAMTAGQAQRLGWFAAAFFTAAGHFDAETRLHGPEWFAECMERRVAELLDRSIPPASTPKEA